MAKKTTQELLKILNRTKPENLSDYFKDNKRDLLWQENPFVNYMKQMRSSHRCSLQDVFTRAKFPLSYGYQLMEGTKHTRQRDYILRFCFATHMTLAETQTALTLYGMNQLYVRIPRDAVLIMAFQNKLYDIAEVNALLTASEMNPLKNSTSR